MMEWQPIQKRSICQRLQKKKNKRWKSINSSESSHYLNLLLLVERQINSTSKQARYIYRIHLKWSARFNHITSLSLSPSLHGRLISTLQNVISVFLVRFSYCWLRWDWMRDFQALHMTSKWWWTLKLFLIHAITFPWHASQRKGGRMKNLFHNL
jgi:hypothetical protein